MQLHFFWIEKFGAGDRPGQYGMRRSHEKEMMDLPEISADLLEEDLRNLRTINRYLGGYRGLLWCMERLINPMESNRFSLLDVGTGSGDMPLAIVRWARRRGICSTVVGLEPHPTTAAVARGQTRGFPEVSIVRGNGFAPPFPPRSFDFVFVSQVLHHFSEDEIVALLKIWSGVARRAVLVSDLIRHPLAYQGIRLLTRLFTRNEMTRTDAPLSVRRSFTLPEWKNLFNRTGIGEFDLFSFFPFRLLALFPLQR